MKTSQTRRSRVRVVSVVTMYLPEDGLPYATAVSFFKNLFVVLVALTGGRSMI
jgi:hypothetical protein